MFSKDFKGATAAWDDICDVILNEWKNARDLWAGLKADIENGKPRENWSWAHAPLERQKAAINRWLAEADTEIAAWEARKAGQTLTDRA